MKKHKIAVAAACVVFFTPAWGAVAAGQTLELVPTPPYQWEPWDNVYEPPSFYVRPGRLVVPPPYEWEPWHNVPDYFPINQPGPPYPIPGPSPGTAIGLPVPYEGWQPSDNVPFPHDSIDGGGRPLPGPEFGRPVPYEGWRPSDYVPVFSPNGGDGGERRLPGPEFGRPVPYEGWEPWHNEYFEERPLPGPDFGRPVPYEGWEPWHNEYFFSPNGFTGAIPEPGTLLLLISGGLGVLVWGRRRRCRR